MRRLLALLLLLASQAEAQTVVNRFLNFSCANNGDGTAATCAASAGAAGAYNDASSAFDDLNTDFPNLVSSNVQIDLSCDDNGTPATGEGEINVQGTTSSTQYTRWFAATGKRCRVSGGFGNGLLKVTSNHFRLENIELTNTQNDANAARGIYFQPSTPGEIRITGNIIKYSPTGTPTTSATNAGIYCAGGSCAQTLIIANNIISGFRKFQIFVDSIFVTTQKTIIYNNTLVGGADECVQLDGQGSSDSLYFKNNVLDCTGTDYNTGYTWTTTAFGNNITGDASSPDGASYQNKTCTYVGSGDYHLGAGDTVCKDAGADLSADAQYAFSIDIDRETRSAPWDISADELVATPTPTPTPSACDRKGQLSYICGKGQL